MPTHVNRMVLTQPSVHKERTAAKAWCAQGIFYQGYSGGSLLRILCMTATQNLSGVAAFSAVMYHVRRCFVN